jgi:co-chaperonin GroES (HSP10)
MSGDEFEAPIGPFMITALQRLGIEKALGFALSEDALSYRPIGDHVLVVVEPIAEKTKGGIVRTERTREQEMGGSGWILAVGELTPYTTTGHISALGAAFGPDPRAYVGLHAVWGRWSGVNMRVEDVDEDFKSKYIIMRECDLLAVKAVKEE